MKPVFFCGDSHRRLREFPPVARQDAGYQLYVVQCGEHPVDFRPMPSIGPGVEEIRIREASGIYRVLYTARLPEAVYVLHAFSKKTQTTSSRDLELARGRFRDLMRGRK